MAFELVSPATRRLTLQRGQCALAKSGYLTLLATQALEISADGWTVVLADAATARLALRKPRPGEPTYRCAPKGSANNSVLRQVMVRAALATLGIPLAQAVGRYDLASHDDLLIVQLRHPAAAAAKGTKSFKS